MREQLNFDTNIVNRIYRQQELKKEQSLPCSAE
jgi:hypothetical protein